MNKYDLINALSSAEEDEVLLVIDGTLYEIDEELGHQPEKFDGFDTAYPALIYLKPIDGEL